MIGAARRARQAARLLPWRIARASDAWCRRGFAEAAVVTLDVFDTALLRSVARPADAFWLAAWRLGQRQGSALDVEATAQARIAAEHRARSAARTEGRHEVTLAEIHRDLPDGLMAEECATERAICFANPEVLALHGALLARGMAVAFISDTYLDQDFTAGLLRDAGYGDAPRVFASSTYGRSKADGDLFAPVAAALGADPARIWHIGDNALADLRRARAAGWNALWYRPTLRPTASPASAATGEARITASLLAGIPASLRAVKGADQVWSSIGHRVAGPIFLGFAQSMAAALALDPVDQVAFCARDGRIVRAAYQRLQERAPGLPPSLYLLVSRRSLVFPMIEQLGEAELDFLTARFAALRVSEFLVRIGLDPAVHAQAIAAQGLAAEQLIATPADATALRELLRALESHIIEAAARERVLLAAYMAQEGCLDAASLAFVDVGWQGSLQKAAARLFAATGRHTRLRGFYFGTSHAIRAIEGTAGTTTGWFVDAGEPAGRYALTRTQWAVLELLFTAGHGSVLSYRKGPAGIEAVLDELFGEDAGLPPYEAAAAAIQAAALAFIDRALAAFGDLPALPITAADVEAPLRRLALAPSLAEARAIGDLFHVDGFGATRTGQHIAQPPAWRAGPARLVAGYRKASWRRGYLIRAAGSRWLAFRLIGAMERLRPGFKSA